MQGSVLRGHIWMAGVFYLEHMGEGCRLGDLMGGVGNMVEDPN